MTSNLFLHKEDKMVFRYLNSSQALIKKLKFSIILWMKFTKRKTTLEIKAL